MMGQFKPAGHELEFMERYHVHSPSALSVSSSPSYAAILNVPQSPCILRIETGRNSSVMKI